MEAQKHGAEYRRQWRNICLGIDARTLETRADNSVGNAPVLPDLLAHRPDDEPLSSMSEDGASVLPGPDCCTRAEIRHTHRRTSKFWNSHSAGAAFRNEASLACTRFGWPLWQQWSGHHRRSPVKTKMRCSQRLGERAMGPNL